MDKISNNHENPPIANLLLAVVITDDAFCGEGKRIEKTSVVYVEGNKSFYKSGYMSNKIIMVGTKEDAIKLEMDVAYKIAASLEEKGFIGAVVQ